MISLKNIFIFQSDSLEFIDITSFYLTCRKSRVELQDYSSSYWLPVGSDFPMPIP